MEKIKISIITRESLVSNRIKNFLNKINIFDVDCMDNISKCVDNYDIIMIDIDSFEKEDQASILQIVKKLSHDDKKFILLKDTDKTNYLQKVDVLFKPITEMKLIDSICNAMLNDLSEIIV